MTDMVDTGYALFGFGVVILIFYLPYTIYRVKEEKEKVASWHWVLIFLLACMTIIGLVLMLQ